MSLTRTQLNNTIRTVFNSTFGSAGYGYTIVWDNAATAAPDGDEVWMRVKLHLTNTVLEEIGHTKHHRNWGRMMVQIFAPTNTGDADIITALDRLDATFRSKGIATNVIFEEGQVGFQGVQDGWYQTNISYPFYGQDIG